MTSLISYQLLTLGKFLLMCLALEGPRLAPQALVSAATKVEAHFAAMPDAKEAEWKTYLHWEDWGPELSQSRLPEREQLEAITHRFYGVREGLEHPALVRMRNELTTFLGGEAALSPQATHPALMIRFNTNILSEELAKFSRNKQDQRDTGAWIAGAWVTGKAHSDAKVTAHLVPYGDAAALEVRVRGTVQTPHTVASSGAFKVHGSATSQLEGVSYLYLDQMEVRATEPKFSARTDSSVSRVEGPKPLRGLARWQANKKQDQGESEGANLVASQAKEQLKKELAVELEKANAELSASGKYHILLQRADLVPTLVTTGLQANAVQLGLRFPGSGAEMPFSAKELAPQTGLEVSMHESLLAAFASNFVRGSTWTDADFARMQRELTGTNANELLIGATPDRWAARWDWKSPISAKINSQGLHYQLAFSQVWINNRSLDTGLSLKASYKPVSKRWGIEFHRIGDIGVASSDPNHFLSDGDQAFLQRKLSALFGETVYLDGLSPPAGGGWDGLASFAISDVRLEDSGWMIISSGQANPKVTTVSK